MSMDSQVKPHNGNHSGAPALLPDWATGLLCLLLAGGIGAGYLMLTSGESHRFWQIYLVNFLFFSGAAIAGLVLVAIFHMTNAGWSRPLERVAVAGVGFLPVSFILFLGLWPGRNELFFWIAEPRPDVADWLSVHSLFVRDGVGLLLLSLVGWEFFRRFLEADAGSKKEESSEGFSGVGGSKARSLGKRAVVLLLFFPVVYTLLAWDLIMSLIPSWSSTVFGGFYFFSTLYLGLGIATSLFVCAGWRFGWEDGFHPDLLHNTGKLIFSFSLLWVYLYWSEYLVVWYGNLPHEIEVMLLRTGQSPWGSVAIAVLGMNFLVPFVVLLSRAARRSAKVLFILGLVVSVGIWLERLLLVAPGLNPDPDTLLGLWELLITLGFFSMYGLCCLWGFRKVHPLKGR